MLPFGKGGARTRRDSEAPMQEEAPPTKTTEKKKRPRDVRIGFGTVEIYHHSPRLAGDRVPSTHGPSVGLGRLQGVSVRRVDSFDTQRENQRQGVQYLDPGERRSLVAPIARQDSVDEVEANAELTRLQREVSNREETPDLDSPRGCESSPPLFSLDPDMHRSTQHAELSLTDLFS